ncbi:fimbrial protein [Pseudomonas sp. PH1b]|uniref:fimbrial protein n=1 Tax=Pseudomonas sp. PH1b TaxID=1397282 RepID=UPI0007C86406|nr:fimbrial protein [Pseudomonas sp. PH1b]
MDSARMGPGTTTALLFLLLAGTTASGRADEGSVDDRQALLQVSGALMESACHLDMSSAYQEVWLGELGTASLQRLGDQGTPVAVHLRLSGCLRTQGGSREGPGGSLVWSTIEPVMGLRLTAVADSANPQLVKVSGAGGFGLRVTDQRKRHIRLAGPRHSWFVSPGSDLLTYYVIPERTAEPLVPGHFHASLNFHLSYD